MTRTVALSIAVAFAFACSSAQPGEEVVEPVEIHPEALAEIEVLLAAKDARTPVQRKISSHLLAAPPHRSKDPRDPMVEPLIPPDAQGRILVEVTGEVTPALLGRIDQLGGRVFRSSSDLGQALVWLDRGRAETLAAEEGVRSIGPALLPGLQRGALISDLRAGRSRGDALRHPLEPALTARPRAARLLDDAHPSTGQLVSAGDVAHAAARARKFFATSGAGVRVGFLSDSDDLLEDAILAEELPTTCTPGTAVGEPCTFTLPGQDGRDDFTFAFGRGTALMEVVHDLAPSAQLYFATAYGGERSFAANIRALRFEQHCDVIIDDTYYFAEAVYQDDAIAQAVDDVSRDGAFYFSAAGDHGSLDSGTTSVWEGDFKVGGKLGTLASGYTVHDFGNGAISELTLGYGGPVVLQWADPGTLDDPRSANDYDIFFLDEQLRHVIVAATDIQDGHARPFEFLPWYLPAGGRLVVAKRPGAANRAMRLTAYNAIARNTSGAISGHAAAAGAFAVGALDVGLANGGEFFGGLTTPVEPYSPDGPRRVFYDRAGRILEEGATFASEGGELRQKPDFVAADWVSVDFTSYFHFVGTSPAAAHAGAIGALIKSAVPRIRPDRMRRALHDGALDIMAKGDDRDSGAGVVMAFESLRQAGAPPGVFFEVGTPVLTGSFDGYAVPGGVGRLQVPLVNNGGAPAAGVVATLSSATPGVEITQATSSYGEVAAGATATGSTPFQFRLAADAPCGYPVQFQVAIAFSGRGKNPTHLVFETMTGKPGTVPHVVPITGGPFPIPDHDGWGIEVPIEVSGVGFLTHVAARFGGSACTTAEHADTVGLDHPAIGTISAWLVPPSDSGARVLFFRPGGAGNTGNNLCQTLFDDGGATPIQGVTADGAPFTGTYRPAQPLSSLVGESADGVWTLHVVDYVSGDTGSLREFELRLTGYECTP